MFVLCNFNKCLQSLLKLILAQCIVVIVVVSATNATVASDLIDRPKIIEQHTCSLHSARVRKIGQIVIIIIVRTSAKVSSSMVVITSLGYS